MTAQQVKTATAVPTTPAHTVHVPGLISVQRNDTYVDSLLIPSLQGKHVTKDKEMAVELWKQAADAGHPKAT